VLQLADANRMSCVVAGRFVGSRHPYRRPHALVRRLVPGRLKGSAFVAEDDLLRCGRDVERNPLAAKLVSEP